MQQSHEAGIIMGPWFADEKISMQRWRSPCPKSCIWSVIIWSQQSDYFQNPCFCQMILSYLLFWRPHLTPAILVGLCHGFSLLWRDAFPCHPWFQAHYSHHLLNSLNSQSYWGWRGWASEAGLRKQCPSVTHFSFPCFFSSLNQDTEARISCPPRLITETKLLSIFLAFLEDELTIRKLPEIECTVQLVQCLPSKQESPHKNVGQVVRTCNSCAGKGEAGDPWGLLDSQSSRTGALQANESPCLKGGELHLRTPWDCLL